MNFFILQNFLFIISMSIKIFGQKVENICHVCFCTELELNCRNLQLHKNFQFDSWKNLSNSKFLECYFDNNHIGHLTVFPPSLPFVKLSYKNNRLIKIDDRAFKALTKLEELDLSMNELTSINLLPSVFEVKFYLTRHIYIYILLNKFSLSF